MSRMVSVALASYHDHDPMSSIDSAVTEDRPKGSSIGKRAMPGDPHVIKVQPLKRSEMQVSSTSCSHDTSVSRCFSPHMRRILVLAR